MKITFAVGALMLAITVGIFELKVSRLSNRVVAIEALLDKRTQEQNGLHQAEVDVTRALMKRVLTLEDCLTVVVKKDIELWREQRAIDDSNSELLGLIAEDVEKLREPVIYLDAQEVLFINDIP